MIGKILFTLAVIGVVLWYFTRNRERVPPQRLEAPGQSSLAKDKQTARRLAWGGVGLVIVLGLFAAGWHWQDHYKEVYVRVVDSQSGQITEYKSRRGWIEDRAFEALDGRRISLAESERMEVSERP